MEKKKPQFIRVFKKIIHLIKILNFKEQHLTFPLGNFIWVCNIQKCAVGSSFNLPIHFSTLNHSGVIYQL